MLCMVSVFGELHHTQIICSDKVTDQANKHVGFLISGVLRTVLTEEYYTKNQPKTQNGRVPMQATL